MSGVLVDESSIRERWLVVQGELNERGRRIWAAAEAMSHGYGGIGAVVRATGISESTVRRAIEEVREGRERPPAGRARQPGAGRRGLVEAHPGIAEDLDALIEPGVRGDPMSPLRWTTRSIANLTGALRDRGHDVRDSAVRLLVRAQGYRLQSNRKTREGTSHPDRNAQFEHIAAVSAAALAAFQPLVSIDCKKKELIGNYKNPGRELAKGGEPVEVNMHDFPDEQLGKAIPYGVYDIGADEAMVSVGVSAETAPFAANAIKSWWTHLGKPRYADATTLTITADCGGANGNRHRLWKTELQRLADEIGLAICVMHFPPGTSKWNKIEHRLFSYISINWRAKPLTSIQVVIDLIAATTTSTGLTVYARLDDGTYPTKIKVSDQEFAAVNITRDEFHPEWSYTITPNSSPPSVINK